MPVVAVCQDLSRYEPGANVQAIDLLTRPGENSHAYVPTPQPYAADVPYLSDD